MKCLTLEKTWKECLRMWKWIIEHLEEYGGDVHKAKRKWIEINYPDESMAYDCFFCEYQLSQCGDIFVKNRRTKYVACPKCPGRLVNRQFRCENVLYDWCDHPKLFYKKLLELNKKRKSND